MSGLDANQEQARVLPIDMSGRHVLKVTTRGPETTAFRIELGGSALPGMLKSAAADRAFSRTFPRAGPPAPADGVIAGRFPASGDGVNTYYYFAANLKAGLALSSPSFLSRVAPTPPKRWSSRC